MSIFCKKAGEMAEAVTEAVSEAVSSAVSKKPTKELKHYFVVNPCAGKGLKSNFVMETIIPACEKAGIDYEIYYTRAPGDGIRFVHATASNGEPARFYACGGDGTLYEVVNGAYGHKNAQVAVVPLGSGNDWTRLFGEKDIFLDIEGQINGTPMEIDCIKADNEIAINQASMGFDAEACAVQGQMKKLPGVAGHLSYYLGGLYCSITKVRNKFKVTIDGEEVKGPFVFVVGCNSRWYGSGIKVAPFAMPNDGLLDFVVMKRRTPWIVMFKVMMNDWQNKCEHVHHRDCEYIRGKKMTIEAKKPCQINIDGECHRVTKTTIELIENGLTFSVPAKSTYFDDVASGKISDKIDIDKKKYVFQRGLI